MVDARGAHWPLGLVEFEDCLVPRQPEEVEHATRLTLDVVHHRLVVCLKKMRGRQDRAPMRHQRLIGAMEAAKLHLAVGESLLVGEELRVAGEAGVHGVAAAMNDPRVRQDKPDHAGAHEIGGHLVDHMPRAARHRRDRGRDRPRPGPFSCAGVKSRDGGRKAPGPVDESGRRLSSPAPWTIGWEARICSMSVVPDRGMPSTNTGRSDRAPWSAFASRSAGEKTSCNARHPALVGFGIIGERSSA